MKKLALASVVIVLSITHSGNGTAANYHVYQWHHATDNSVKQDCSCMTAVSICCDKNKTCHRTAHKGRSCPNHAPPRANRG